MAEKRKRWSKNMAGHSGSELVFLDESSVNTDMTRRYARSLGGTRAVDSAPICRPKSTTILSSICKDGRTTYTSYPGGTTAERFADYLKNILSPTLDKNALVIMDNMRSHHAKKVQSLLEEAGVNYCYLPPYSPDLNPIEKLWSKLKTFLRREKARTLEALPAAIDRAFRTICHKDCIGWFAASGYVR